VRKFPTQQGPARPALTLESRGPFPDEQLEGFPFDVIISEPQAATGPCSKGFCPSRARKRRPTQNFGPKRLLGGAYVPFETLSPVATEDRRA